MKRLVAMSSLLASTLLLTSCSLGTPISHYHTNSWNRVHYHKEPNVTVREEHYHHPRYHHNIHPSYRYRDRGSIIKERFERHGHAQPTRRHNTQREPSRHRNEYRYHNDQDSSCRNHNYRRNNDRQRDHCDLESRYNNRQHHNRDRGRIKKRLFKD